MQWLFSIPCFCYYRCHILAAFDLQPQRYPTVTPESIIAELHLPWRTCCPNRGEAEDGNTIKQRGNQTEASDEGIQNESTQTFIETHHRLVASFAVRACLCAPSMHWCTAACGDLLLLIMGEEEVVISVYFYTGVLLLITNGNQSEVSASDFGHSYEQTPEFLSSPFVSSLQGLSRPKFEAFQGSATSNTFAGCIFPFQFIT